MASLSLQYQITIPGNTEIKIKLQEIIIQTNECCSHNFFLFTVFITKTKNIIENNISSNLKILDIFINT